MLAVHLDGLLFFLLVGIAIFFRMLSKKAGAGTEEDQAPPAGTQPPLLPPQASADSDEVRIRKFLEALGQPTSSIPPPPVKPRPTPDPVPELQRKQIEEAARTAQRRNLMNPLPPLTTVPPPVPQRRVTLPREMAAEPARKKLFVPQAAEPTVFEVQRTAEPAVPPPLPLMAAEAAKVFETAVGSSIAAAPATTTPRTSLRTLLGSREDLQRAIILREVFGPPRGLQPLDAIGLG